MSTPLMESLAATEAMSRIFSDASVLTVMLNVEVALARAEATCGVIPEHAANVIREVAQAMDLNVEELVREALRAGTPAIPLVRALTEKVRAKDQSAGDYVHWGSTSQDVVDTTLVLLLEQCRQVLARNHQRMQRGLRHLSEEHSQTAMLARTLLQPAPPITFGLKAAGWFAALRRGWSRVESRFAESKYLQFGGASGTLAGLGSHGIQVSEALANDLELRHPDAPWHAHRDRLAALLAALSIYTASLGKMALDIALLMQYEVGEAAEPGGDGRGGSSSMPNKQNPMACTLTIAASKRTPGLLANFLNGMLQEHERGLGGWQSEWTTVTAIVQAAGVAAESMVEVVEGLKVDADRMRRNIAATGGTMFAEKAVLAQAKEGVQNPEDFLGSAEVFRVRLLRGDD
jgi:3-carboxy-cis,cis-muconate cycloisomerase